MPQRNAHVFTAHFRRRGPMVVGGTRGDAHRSAIEEGLAECEPGLDDEAPPSDGAQPGEPPAGSLPQVIASRAEQIRPSLELHS